jgi:hypothetical protein
MRQLQVSLKVPESISTKGDMLELAVR